MLYDFEADFLAKCLADDKLLVKVNNKMKIKNNCTII